MITEHRFGLTFTTWRSITGPAHSEDRPGACCIIITYIDTLHRGLSHTPADLQHDFEHWCSSAALRHPALLHHVDGLLPPWHTHPVPGCTAHTSVYRKIVFTIVAQKREEVKEMSVWCSRCFNGKQNPPIFDSTWLYNDIFSDRWADNKLHLAAPSWLTLQGCHIIDF